MPNGTEFSYVIFTEQQNFTTAERRNGNGRTATEWWKSGNRRVLMKYFGGMEEGRGARNKEQSVRFRWCSESRSGTKIPGSNGSIIFSAGARELEAPPGVLLVSPPAGGWVWGGGRAPSRENF